MLHSVTFDSSGTFVATCGNDGEARIWDSKTGAQIRLIKHNVECMAVEFSPSGDRLAVASKDGRISLHSVLKEEPTQYLFGHKSQAMTLAFTPDGKSLATGGADNSVRIWHLLTGRELLSFKDLPARVNRVAFSPDGRTLAAALHDASVRLWHAPLK